MLNDPPKSVDEPELNPRIASSIGFKEAKKPSLLSWLLGEMVGAEVKVWCGCGAEAGRPAEEYVARLDDAMEFKPSEGELDC